MADVFEYLAWRGDLDFNQSPLNPVDLMIFSQLSYIPFDGIVSGPDGKEGISIDLAAKILNEKMETKKSGSGKKLEFMYREDPLLINALASSNRFRNCHLFDYVNQVDTKLEVQFSALCIYTGDSYIIVFRGTDAALVGWKEDFNMAFKEVIPAQLKAVKYLEEIAPLTKGALHIAGHSKGGNLGIYASAYCGKDIQKRIKNIYSYDAPGFYNTVLTSDGFNTIKDKIQSYVPQSSVVGMFLEHAISSKIVKSTQIGLLQHSLYSWEVAYNDLIHVDDLTARSRFVDKTLKEWLAGLSNEQREKFIDTMFDILNSSDAKSLYEFEASWLASMGKIIKAIGHIDDPTRKLIRKTFRDLLRSAGRNIDTLLKQERHEN
ncbi:MAG: DUF2974 domain-containing protein [Treponema sp.]|jgi:hypothetical protein|nr:DUF2974 domain-containing protein [Treponema sp.]